MREEIIQKLFAEALQVRKKAYTPYSGFKVGAALLTVENEIFTGCNVENASYGLTICAERNAVFKAVSSGETNFDGLLILTDQQPPGTPCGACCQVLAEFNGDLDLILANISGEKYIKNLKDFLPFPFSGGDNP